MVGPHEVKLPALEDAHDLPRRPDVVAEQRGGARRRVEKVFSDPLARRVVDGMDLLARGQKPPHHLLARGAVRRIPYLQTVFQSSLCNLPDFTIF